MRLAITLAALTRFFWITKYELAGPQFCAWSVLLHGIFLLPSTKAPQLWLYEKWWHLKGICQHYTSSYRSVSWINTVKIKNRVGNKPFDIIISMCKSGWFGSVCWILYCPLPLLQFSLAKVSLLLPYLFYAPGDVSHTLFFPRSRVFPVLCFFLLFSLISFRIVLFWMAVCCNALLWQKNLLF